MKVVKVMGWKLLVRENGLVRLAGRAVVKQLSLFIDRLSCSRYYFKTSSFQLIA